MNNGKVINPVTGRRIKKDGATYKKLLSSSAVKIQKHVRGMINRKKVSALKSKSPSPRTKAAVLIQKRARGIKGRKDAVKKSVLLREEINRNRKRKYDVAKKLFIELVTTFNSKTFEFSYADEMDIVREIYKLLKKYKIEASYHNVMYNYILTALRMKVMKSVRATNAYKSGVFGNSMEKLLNNSNFKHLSNFIRVRKNRAKEIKKNYRTYI